MRHEAPSYRTKRILAGLLVRLVVIVRGFGNTRQPAALQPAAKAEQQFTADNAAAIIAEYKRVIALQPGSEWARKSQARVEALEARVKAEELPKAVFQEHRSEGK